MSSTSDPRLAGGCRRDCRPAETIPDAIAHFFEDDAHFALAIGHIDDILSAVVNSTGWNKS
jgi:hypothetical protein